MRAIRQLNFLCRKNITRRYFSSATPEQEKEEELKLRDFERFISDHEIQSDSKFRDMSAQFEREWNNFVQREQRMKVDYLEKELYPEQREKLDFLVREIKGLSTRERDLFNHLFLQKSIEFDGLNPMSLDVKSPQFQGMCRITFKK